MAKKCSISKTLLEIQKYCTKVACSYVFYYFLAEVYTYYQFFQTFNSRFSSILRWLLTDNNVCRTKTPSHQSSIVSKTHSITELYAINCIATTVISLSSIYSLYRSVKTMENCEKCAEMLSKERKKFSNSAQKSIKCSRVLEM